MGTIESWKRRGLELGRRQRRMAWAIGEWWLSGRAWDRERIRFIGSADWEGPALQTVRNYAALVQQAKLYQIRETFPLHYFDYIRGLPASDKKRLLKRAAAQAWTSSRLVAEATRVRQAHSMTEYGQAFSLEELVQAERKFGTILADPPWTFDNDLVNRRIARHYPQMSLEEIQALPVRQLRARNANLHLWVPQSLIRQGFMVMEAWGFRDSGSALVWHKQSERLGGGNYWRIAHELLLLGIAPDAGRFADSTIPSLVSAPRGRHSEKPEIVRALIERVSPGPRLELFARVAANGWTTWGHLPRDTAARVRLS